MKTLTLVSAVMSLMALSTTVFGMPSPGSIRSALQARQNGTDSVVGEDLPFGSGITFEGPAFVGGANITFTGTAEGFWNRVHELNPNYDADFKDIIAAQNATDTAADVADSQHRITCYHDGLYASSSRIQQGVSYLYGLNAACSSPKRFCERVSCSYASGIYLCNAKFHPISVPCNRLARMAAQGNFKCRAHEQVHALIRSNDGFAVNIQKGGC